MKKIIAFILALLTLLSVVLYGVLNQYFVIKELRLYHLILITAVILFVVVVIVIINHDRATKIKSLEDRLTVWSNLSYFVNKIGDEAFNTLPIGILLYDKESLSIKWNNPYSAKIFNNSNLENIPLNDLSEDLIVLIESNNKTTTITLNTKKYDLFHNKDNQVLYLFDVTERENIKKLYEDHLPALGIIHLENVEEALQGFDLSEKSNIRGEYLGAITDWVNEYNGFLKLFTEEKILIAFHFEQLKKIIETKFELLNKIKEISAKHNVKISISLGIACWDVPFEELNILAQNAIDLAEKRGGDQAVVNIQNQKITYFGGKTDATEKSSRVQVRVNAQKLKDLIENSRNVLTIAHQHTDIDALGAMIGILKMVESSNVACKIVADYKEMDDTVKKIIVDLEKESSKTFKAIITSEEALKLIDEETLLVVVDTQSPKLVSSEAVLKKAKKIAVIDHHRHGEDTFLAPFFYVEPYASSSVELVAEMMEFYQNNIKLDVTESSIMFGGILVDTNEFSYRTGTRTFGAASYLKEHGASSLKVKEWLRISKEQTIVLNEMLSKLVTVANGYGIIVDNSETIKDRVTIARASEKILDIDKFNAGFTIAKIGPNTIGVSGRSLGQINVQTILEEMGGGGHYNSAATQIIDKSIAEVFEALKAIILRETDEGVEKMKIILLEDVKSKGAKDDIIDVPMGYGRYLISEKKALLATDESIAKLEEKKLLEIEKQKQQEAIMKKLKEEIEAKSVNIFITVGQDGKLFGSVTPKMIAEAYKEQNGIEFDRRKLELTSEINSIGIYTATINLSKNIKAQLEINVLEK